MKLALGDGLDAIGQILVHLKVHSGQVTAHCLKILDDALLGGHESLRAQMLHNNFVFLLDSILAVGISAIFALLK